IWTTGVRRAWRVSGQGWQGGAAVAPAAGYYAAITVPGTGPGAGCSRICLELKMKEIVTYLGGAVLTAALMFGAYWLAKHGSYWLWYDSMVKETIQEMVKPEALKGR
ncbi:MAG: hypothetical protein KAX46_14635, partial [Chromatiaceae bacterium]|nr:hypothetical protein [Chromatiaceae bacterium]